jgi:hypothetical protein
LRRGLTARIGTRRVEAELASWLQLHVTMFVYRSIALGLLGACCLLLAMRPPIAVVSHAPGQILVASSREVASVHACVAPGSTIVDVATGVNAAQLAALLHLLPDERVVSIDDVPVAGTLDAGVALAGVELRRGRYVDLGVKSDWGERRVLVLLH